MEYPIRWGVLGASKFAREQMAPAIHAAENAVLAGLATSDTAKAAPFQALAPGLKVINDYEALLADPEIDAIYIPLPNSLHVPWTLKAVAAGKHVLCEKPIAMTEAEYDQLIAARDASGLMVAEAYMITHHPQWARARDLLSEGAIGRLRHVEGVFSYFKKGDGNIRLKAELGGGGLADIGVYPFGATRFVSGAEPESVTAQIDWENGVDTFALVTANFPGFTFSGTVSMRMALRQGMVFHGEAGVMRLPAPFNPPGYGEARIVLDTASGCRVERFTEARQYVTQVEAFGRSIVEGAPYASPLEFSRGTQRMIDMVKAAGKEET